MVLLSLKQESERPTCLGCLWGSTWKKFFKQCTVKRRYNNIWMPIGPICFGFYLQNSSLQTLKGNENICFRNILLKGIWYCHINLANPLHLDGLQFCRKEHFYFLFILFIHDIWLCQFFTHSKMFQGVLEKNI